MSISGAPTNWWGAEESAWYRRAGFERGGFPGYYLDALVLRLDRFRIPPRELNHKREEPRPTDVAPPARRNQRNSGHRRRSRLAIRVVIDVKCVGRIHPAAIDEHGGPVREAERRNQCDARCSLEAASRPGLLGVEIIDAAGNHASPARAVSGESLPDLEWRQCEPRRQHGIPRPALRQAIELPDPGTDAQCRNDHGADRELYVAALHSASFAARESRRMAASRRSALPRSGTASR